MHICTTTSRTPCIEYKSGRRTSCVLVVDQRDGAVSDGAAGRQEAHRNKALAYGAGHQSKTSVDGMSSRAPADGSRSMGLPLLSTFLLSLCSLLLPLYCCSPSPWGQPRGGTGPARGRRWGPARGRPAAVPFLGERGQAGGHGTLLPDRLREGPRDGAGALRRGDVLEIFLNFYHGDVIMWRC